MGGTISRKTEVVSEEQKAIDAFIDLILADGDLNQSVIPDQLERNIYRRVIQFGLHAIKKTLTTVSIRFLNHEIVMTIHPLNENNIRHLDATNS